VTRSVETNYDLMKRLVESAGGEVSSIPFDLTSFFFREEVQVRVRSRRGSSQFADAVSVVLAADADLQSHPESNSLHGCAG